MSEIIKKGAMSITVIGKKLEIRFPYSRRLVEEVKSLKDARWPADKFVGNDKYWTAANCQRNWFNIDYNANINVFARYDQELTDVPSSRDLRDNQKQAFAHAIIRKRAILGAEMGLGKTLIAIELMEYAGGVWVYVAPKTALAAVELELEKWSCTVKPILTTYESLKKLSPTRLTGIIFDECQKIKTPGKKRSNTAIEFCESIASRDGYVYLMSGTPAPNNPCDWWNLCEAACPGYLKEGTVTKLKFRLGVFQKQEGMSGNTFNKLIAWKDKDDHYCDSCGLPRTEHNTSHAYIASPTDYNVCAICNLEQEMHDADHPFITSKNEVALLAERMGGLVITQLKKDWIDLPDKEYFIERLEPSQEMKDIARYIVDTSPRAITALTLLRELSDGFQYIEKETDKIVNCNACKGTGKTFGMSDEASSLDLQDSLDLRLEPETDGNSYEYQAPDLTNEPILIECFKCKGSGKMNQVIRDIVTIATPKDDWLLGELKNHEDIGRITVFAAFKGSIKKLYDFIQLAGWEVIRVDGDGVKSTWGKTHLPSLIKEFQHKDDRKICYLAHPGAGGIGVTLTASPTELYYSNDFNFEYRAQSEDRGHRPGMDMNRGLRICDCFVLPSDELVYDNLKQKRKMMNIPMHRLREDYESI